MQRKPTDNLPQQIIDNQVADHRLELVRRFAGTPRNIDQLLRSFVYGQDHATRTLSVVLHNHIKRAQKVLEGEKPSRVGPLKNVLLIGPSGVGKTALCRAMAGVTSLSVKIADASNLTEVGWQGGSVDDVIFGLISASNNCRELAGISLIVLDELDKCRRQDTHGVRDIGGVGIQENLLSVLDGGELPLKAYTSEKTLGWAETFSTKNLMVIGAGAFVGLTDIIARRLRGKKQIGFSAAGQNPHAQPEGQDILDRVTAQDLIDFGLLPELVGRFGVIQPLHPLSSEVRLDILKKSPHGPVTTLQAQAELAGFQLRFAKPLLLRMIEMTEGSPVGVRGMFSIAERVTQRAFYEVPDQLRRTRYAVPIVTVGLSALEDGSYSLKWGAAEEEPPLEFEDLFES